jgi:hypothetical protein
MDVVKTDTKIESMIIPIINLDIDSTLTTDDYNSHILVEQWKIQQILPATEKIKLH